MTIDHDTETYALPVGYPDICFWDRNAPSIRFANPGDFHRDRLLSSLGITHSRLVGSFGITDRREIISRQELMKFLLNNPELHNILLEGRGCSNTLPREGQAFVDYFYPKDGGPNAFWKFHADFLKALGGSSRPEQFEALRKFMRRMSRLEKEEGAMAEKVRDEILRTTLFQGLIEYDLMVMSGGIELEVSRTDTIGYKMYSPISTEHRPPRWTRWTVARWLGLKRAYEAISSRLKRRRVLKLYAPLVVRTTPEVIVDAVRSFLLEQLGELKSNRLPSLDKAEDRIKLSVVYKYDQGGLQFKLVDIVASGKKKDEVLQHCHQFLDSKFEGFGWLKRASVRSMNYTLTKMERHGRRNLVAAALTRYFDDKSLHQVFITMPVKHAKKVDATFRWQTVVALYELCPETFRASREYREFIGVQMQELREVAVLVDSFRAQADRWNLPLEFPDILPDEEHLVSFDTLEPIRLIGQKKKDGGFITVSDLVPITLPAINGQMMVLTGANAGGKTVTLETVIDLVWLGQSGVPLFGSVARMNIKRQLGMVFLERGAGSTSELLLSKTATALDAIIHGDIPPNETLLVIDEVGTGTQEVAGYEFGKKLLEKLHDLECSVLCSTQITDLAKFAEARVGASCYNFLPNHSIEKGIGVGQMDKLMEQVGLTELLKSDRSN